MKEKSGFVHIQILILVEMTAIVIQIIVDMLVILLNLSMKWFIKLHTAIDA